MPINIIWKGCEPRFVGVGNEVKNHCSQGVTKFNSWDEAEKFIENESVSYGEQGGSFKVSGAWEGNTCRELESGKADFLTPNDISFIREQKEREKRIDKIEDENKMLEQLEIDEKEKEMK